MSKTFLFQVIQYSQTVLIQTIQFSISIVFVHIQLNVKTFLFQTIQSEPGTDYNEGMFCIPQISCIIGISPSDCLVTYPGHLLEGFFSPLQRCSRCILLLQPTGQVFFLNSYIYIYIVKRRKQNEKYIQTNEKIYL